MEEKNPLVENFLLQAKTQKRQANIFLILMLALFGCAVFLFFQLKDTNTELKAAKEAAEQASGYKSDSERKDGEIQELKRLLEECKDRFSQSDSLSKSIQQIITPTASTLKYSNNLVYIHIRGGQESDVAKKLLQRLKSEGFIAPGIQEITDRKFRNRIFYFNDEDRSTAEDVERFLSETLNQNGKGVPKDLSIMKPGVQAPKGQIEIWLNLTD